jgi:hypothetical protein
MRWFSLLTKIPTVAAKQIKSLPGQESAAHNDYLLKGIGTDTTGGSSSSGKKRGRKRS